MCRDTVLKMATGLVKRITGGLKKITGGTCAKKKKNHLQDFEVGDQLGSGGFGQVFLVREKCTGRIRAMKIISKSKLTAKSKFMLEREMDNHSRLSHPYILHMYTAFKDDDHVYLILEYARGGNLISFLLKLDQGRLNSTLAARFVSQIADAILYIHQNGIIHRNIQPENLYLVDSGDIKIGDFGASVYTKIRRNTRMGISPYLAPEIISRKKYDHNVDIWSLGVVCFEMLDGNTPYHRGYTTVELVEMGDKRINFPEHIEESAQDLIFRLLDPHPEERISLPEVLEHPWIVGARAGCLVPTTV